MCLLKWSIVSDNPRWPIKWCNRDADTESVIVYHVWNTLIVANIRDNTDMPEMVGWELIEYDNISWLPLFEIFDISWGECICEYFCCMVKIHKESFYSTIVDIGVHISIVWDRIFSDICLYQGTEVISHITIRSPDDIGTHSCVWWWESSISIVSIRDIICFYDTNLLFCLRDKIDCSS
jgi:hypothetical protein